MSIKASICHATDIYIYRSIDQLLCYVTSNDTNHGIDWKVCFHSVILVTL